MIAAAIDVGTNSIKLAVGHLDRDGNVHILHNASEITRLGESVDGTGKLTADAQDRALDVLARFVCIARDLGAAKIRIGGTSAMRDAANREDFVRMVHDRLGVELEVLSEDDECRLSYKAVALDPDLGEFEGWEAVVDVGGGSSEMIVGRGREITFGKSLQIGAVRLTERCFKHDPPNPEELADAASIADRLLADAVGNTNIQRLVGVGGSAVNLARIQIETPPESSGEVHGMTLTGDDLRNLTVRLAAVTSDQRRLIPGLDPERADIIIAGAVILERIVKALGAPEMIVSVRGLRFGLLYEEIYG